MSLPGSSKTLILPTERAQPMIDFDALKLRLASPEEILSWSHGEVLFPETINYRTQKPERDGLFCEKIFGPVKDWECACGKYKKVRYRGIVCDRCGVEVTRSLVRRERMGHISLAAPVTHIWFLKGVPSRIGLLLDLSVQTLEKVVYFAEFIITNVKEELKEEILNKLEKEFKDKKKQIKKEYPAKSSEYNKRLQDLTRQYQMVRREVEEIRIGQTLSEIKYHDLSLKFGHIFEAGIGAEAILKMLENLDLPKLSKILTKEKRRTLNPARKKKIIQRLKLINNLIANKIKPEWMVLKVVPVIPPDLRPMVQLDGGRFASSDLNDLYRRVINRNNRLKKLKELNAPEVILRNEKRMLQEAVDALIDNEMRSGKTVIASTGQRRPLKSLADILKGKEGRFRQNLLGKRVDYSGRSVIVVGPYLKLDQCGLPKVMAIELFRPFVISQLIKRGIVHNVRSANRFIETGAKEVWDILEEITNNSYVLLNRAPTLHRLSIQAFRPVLVEGKAIQIHPLVCPAFNADFDGDQMAVHLPITEQGLREAKEIILSTKNLLKPAIGEPIVTPSKDMVWGAYYLTLIRDDISRPDNQIKIFANEDEAVLAYEIGKISLQEKIKVNYDGQLKEISAGRIIFNSILPANIYQLDKVVDRKVLKDIVVQCLETYGRERTVVLLDDIKELTLKYLTQSGLSWGMDDLTTLPGKEEIIKEAERKVDEIQKQYEMGLLAEDERYLKNIENWMKTKDIITDLCRKTLNRYGPVLTMVESGARGSWTQLTQMLGMKGIVSSPIGRLIELPIKSSYKEGFNVLEYFISTHGARKGVSDTALRTASAGYLTRRMIDVTQDVAIREEDCGDKEGLILTKEESEEMGEKLSSRLWGRTVAETIIDPKTKKIIIKSGEVVDTNKMRELEKLDLKQVRIRSVLTCKTRRGLCAKCYGYDLGFNEIVKVNTPVGIVAAQSIGEPGTQLTLRTFHTGGIAGRDITQGLPRVEELLEVRPPKRPAYMAKHDGKVQIVEEKRQRKIKIKYQTFKEEVYILEEEELWHLKVKDGQEVDEGEILAEKETTKGKIKKIAARHKGKVALEDEILKVIYPANDVDEYDITAGYLLLVKDGQEVKAGDQLTDGSLNLTELYELRGREATQKYLLKELQYIYSSQGQKLNDKHFEIIIRQMFSRLMIQESGDTDLLPGEIVPWAYFEECNQKAAESGGKPAKGKELLLGITRAALSTDSFLSAASFQETSRVLINAAISGRPDYLHGLKENVIIGRLIPAGTGLEKKSK
ncbi:MAG: DNA-directed RNA polymerase subunit beta' [Patescibacteria group bacterium]